MSGSNSCHDFEPSLIPNSVLFLLNLQPIFLRHVKDSYNFWKCVDATVRRYRHEGCVVSFVRSVPSIEAGVTQEKWEYDQRTKQLMLLDVDELTTIDITTGKCCMNDEVHRWMQRAGIRQVHIAGLPRTDGKGNVETLFVECAKEISGFGYNVHFINDGSMGLFDFDSENPNQWSFVNPFSNTEWSFHNAPPVFNRLLSFKIKGVPSVTDSSELWSLEFTNPNSNKTWIVEDVLKYNVEEKSWTWKLNGTGKNKLAEIMKASSHHTVSLSTELPDELGLEYEVDLVYDTLTKFFERICTFVYVNVNIPQPEHQFPIVYVSNEGVQFMQVIMALQSCSLMYDIRYINTEKARNRLPDEIQHFKIKQFFEVNPDDEHVVLIPVEPGHPVFTNPIGICRHLFARSSVEKYHTTALSFDVVSTRLQYNLVGDAEKLYHSLHDEVDIPQLCKTLGLWDRMVGSSKLFYGQSKQISLVDCVFFPILVWLYMDPYADLDVATSFPKLAEYYNDLSSRRVSELALPWKWKDIHKSLKRRFCA